MYIIKNKQNSYYEIEDNELQSWIDSELEDGDIIFKIEKVQIAKQDTITLENFKGYHVGFGEIK